MVDVSKYLDPARPVRRAITGTLIVGGGLAGALFGLALTPVGKILTDARPADLANYLWNAGVFGVMGSALAPLVTWSALRNVPIWRTVVEPLAGAAIGAAVAAVLGWGVGLLALPPLGALAAITRLGSFPGKSLR